MTAQNTTDAQRLAVDSFRTFLVSEVKPVALAFRGGPIPRERMRELTEGIAEFGLPGASIALEHGGMGLSVLTEALLLEELCVISSEVAHCVISNMLVASVLVELPAAQAVLRERYLPGLLAGRLCAGFYLREADAQACDIETGISAWSTADGWVINGAHERVCNGHYSDLLIIPVHPEQGALCHVLVEREQHGYDTRLIDRPSLSATFNTQVSFRNVRLPSAQTLWNQADEPGRCRLLQKVDAGMALLSIGLMRAVLEACIIAVQHADCSATPAAAQPLVALRIAEMATGLEATRLMGLQACSLLDCAVDSRMQTCMARWLASEATLRACQQALQLPGGRALSSTLDLDRLIREAIVLPAPHGLTDSRKLFIANMLTGISASN